ncbi:thioesterase family protein [Prolixibacteraceae bacterium Z1-6]|uniref:Thioesterase family protein n=1 Tax=Draconibacterium aestuarii TaxID=2998507 RepID=A0A9X3F5F0_9BACT|nr:thioesterase family protein [Prolixibacteraceae bacterium Z1-6]
MQKLQFTEPIYTYQIDFVGHVNNIIYVQWLENARVKLIEAMDLSILDLSVKEDILPIITETTIQYKKPFFLNNKVQVEVWVSELFNVSANFKFRFLNEKGDVCSTAQQKVLFIDKATQRPSRKIIKFKENFERYLIQE